MSMGELVEWLWWGKTKVLEENPVPFSRCPLQNPHGLKLNPGLRDERLATTASAITTARVWHAANTSRDEKQLLSVGRTSLSKLTLPLALPSIFEVDLFTLSGVVLTTIHISVIMNIHLNRIKESLRNLLMHRRFWWRNLRTRNHLEYLDVD
jgi:hypothetical protein